MTSLDADEKSANADLRSKDLYNSKDAAEFFADLGLPVSPLTLCKLRSVGGGPTFRKFGKYAVYERQALVDWAQSRLSAPRSSTAANPSVRMEKMRATREQHRAEKERAGSAGE